MESKTGVYMILNSINGRCYVGSTSKSFSVRWAAHRNDLRLGKHGNIHLQNAWNKYKESSFEFVILEYAPPEKCVEVEQIHIDAMDVFQNGYNRSPTAGSILGVKMPGSMKKKTAARMRGVPMEDYVKEKIRVAHLGKPKSDEHKKNLWKNRTGWKHSEESKKKTSETLRKMVASGRRLGPPEGWHHSEESRAKLSNAGKGKPKSEEHKRKIRESHRLRAARMKGQSND